MNQFKAILKQLRKAFGLSQQALSEQIGTTRASVSSWEIGRAQPDIENLVLLARTFDVTVDYLLGLEYEDGTKIESADANVMYKLKL